MRYLFIASTIAFKSLSLPSFFSFLNGLKSKAWAGLLKLPEAFLTIAITDEPMSQLCRALLSNINQSSR